MVNLAKKKAGLLLLLQHLSQSRKCNVVVTLNLKVET